MSRTIRHAVQTVTVGIVLAIFASSAAAERPADGRTPSAARGWELLLNKPYLTRDLTDAEFDRLWKVWPAELRQQAAAATPQQRRKMAFSRYGLIESPEPRDGLPLGFVRDEEGYWVMNCLICHGGKVAGRVIPGLGNSHFAFQTLVQDVIRSRTAQGRKLTPEEFRQLATPLGRTNGTTNAQTFSVALVALRDADMNFHPNRPLPKLTHYDLDAPPLWNTKKKTRLYIDGYVGKSARVIMQFVLIPKNDAETIKGWESDFRDVLAWIESLEAPDYPWEIDAALAAQGEALFVQHCAECHGTYGPDGEYPEKTVPIDEVGTDATRLRGMPRSHRRFFANSWFSDGGRLEVIEDPEGYVAPPLDGIWASAPYFHNGSVPTLWHVMHADQRPTVWRRTEDGYDRQRVGLEVETFDELPASVRRADEKRTYFDTRLPGKSAAGHTFPEALSEDEKRAVLEYLKTL